MTTPELWQPKGHLERLKKGQRVRVVGGSECMTEWPDRGMAPGHPQERYAYDYLRTGVIREVWQHPGFPHHDYIVYYDEPYSDPLRALVNVVGGIWAATELEVLE